MGVLDRIRVSPIDGSGTGFRVQVWLHLCCLTLGMGVLGGCSPADAPLSDPLKRSSIIDGVNQALNDKRCSDALIQVEPYYHSSYSDNRARLAIAATYGCFAGLDFFKLINDLTEFNGDLSGSGFWEFLVQEFPSFSTPVDDKIPQSAQDGTAALMAALKPGIVQIPSHLITTDPNNIQSIAYTDRIDDSNIYLAFLSMALMGSLQYRYGKPTANFHKSTNLPWITASLMKGDGCSYVAGVLNFFDGVEFIVLNASSKVASAFGKIESALDASLNLACIAGCAACSITCTECPMSLRDYTSCTGAATDVNSCAGAQIIQFVNLTWQGPP